ncbi:lasso peptide biosynthesis PqqD family chaperone [Paenibacillus sp. GSMTC-2017]|uniref:lasso peptide biosynthesis PqqD family chaperone n=1 Tax=Paenibacillus sp. GSMTC-2017 TaxID=2794350 RepID=UPI0018D63D21|nr:lasso peptide biosynthesis PqqD family chaperone [Paenibacillus sp. GSMTC-2017]MBH5319650.1 lasso peptide biosynthesis PqqD family chaperone [Paenibacillus sp. GSMTC-2017]
MVKTITLDSKVKQTAGHIVSDIDGEKVVLHIVSCKYYNLGDIGGDIWSLVEEASSINQIVQSLLEQYNVEQSECERTVLSFVEHLHTEGLVEIADE